MCLYISIKELSHKRNKHRLYWETSSHTNTSTVQPLRIWSCFIWFIVWCHRVWFQIYLKFDVFLFRQIKPTWYYWSSREKSERGKYKTTLVFFFFFCSLNYKYINTSNKTQGRCKIGDLKCTWAVKPGNYTSQPVFLAPVHLKQDLCATPSLRWWEASQASQFEIWFPDVLNIVRLNEKWEWKMK